MGEPCYPGLNGSGIHPYFSLRILGRGSSRPTDLPLGSTDPIRGGSAQNGIASDLYLVEVRRLRVAATGPARFDA